VEREDEDLHGIVETFPCRSGYEHGIACRRRSFIIFSFDPAMPLSRQEMDQYLQDNSYSVEMIPKLEEFLDEQVKGNTPAHTDANRTLVKLYHLFGKYNSGNCVTCCMIALLDFPKSDLLALTYLLPTSILQQDIVRCIQECSDLLEGCKFDTFWQEYKTLQSSSNENVKTLANRGVASLQLNILETLALTYKRAPKSVVTEALGGVSDIPPSPVVATSDASSVTFASSLNNSRRERVFQDSVGFSSICGLMKKISQQ